MDMQTGCPPRDYVPAAAQLLRLSDEWQASRSRMLQPAVPPPSKEAVEHARVFSDTKSIMKQSVTLQWENERLKREVVALKKELESALVKIADLRNSRSDALYARRRQERIQSRAVNSLAKQMATLQHANCDHPQEHSPARSSNMHTHSPVRVSEPYPLFPDFL